MVETRERMITEPIPERGFRAPGTGHMVAGSLFGYLIGHFAFDMIEPWLCTTKC